MADYSNRVIVALLAVALVVTVVSVSKLNGLGGTYSYLTGAAVDSSQTGQTNITITATTSMTLGVQSINFGSGRVNASCNFCSMDSEARFLSGYSNGSNTGGYNHWPAGNYGDRNCCVGFNLVENGFLMENTGNVNLSVGYTCTGNCTRESFIGGSVPSGGIGGGSGLEIRISANSLRNIENEGESGGQNDTSTSCVGGGSYYRDSGWNITNSSAYQSGMTNGVHYAGASNSAADNSYIALSSRGHWLCGNYTHSPLMPDNNKDAGVLDINVTINNDAPGTGVRSSFTLTFNATSQ